MRKGPLVLLMAAFLLFAVSACSGGGGEGGGGEAKERAKPRITPSIGDLRPGKYGTDEFEPAFSFEVVGEGWVIATPEERGVLELMQGAKGPFLSFFNEQKVIDPGKTRDLVSVSAPEDLAAWLQGHPYLETEEPQPAVVGGVKGTQIDATVGDVPASDCGDACLGLFEAPPDIVWVAFEKEQVRFTVLEDVGGERVVVAVEAKAGDFEKFLPKAQAVLETVEWEDT